MTRKNKSLKKREQHRREEPAFAFLIERAKESWKASSAPAVSSLSTHRFLSCSRMKVLPQSTRTPWSVIKYCPTTQSSYPSSSLSPCTIPNFSSIFERYSWIWGFFTPIRITAHLENPYSVTHVLSAQFYIVF